MKSKLLHTLLFSLALSLALFALTTPVYADEWVVDNATDGNDESCSDGDCSLREAIDTATDGDIITFAGDYAITLNSELSITKELTIDGSSNDIIIAATT